MAAIEQQFGISLSMDETVETFGQGDMCNILDRHGV
jgi:acyl carrier protein